MKFYTELKKAGFKPLDLLKACGFKGDSQSSFFSHFIRQLKGERTINPARLEQLKKGLKKLGCKIDINNHLEPEKWRLK